MRPTRLSLLLVILLAVAALTWGTLSVIDDRGGNLPRITWTAPVGILALAVLVLLVALGLRSRLRRGVRMPPALSMAQLAVLGKATAHVGPIVAGLYAGYTLVLLPHLDILGRRALLTSAAFVAGLLLAASGLVLERTCRVCDDDNDSTPTALA